MNPLALSATRATDDVWLLPVLVLACAAVVVALVWWSMRGPRG